MDFLIIAGMFLMTILLMVLAWPEIERQEMEYMEYLKSLSGE